MWADRRWRRRRSETLSRTPPNSLTSRGARWGSLPLELTRDAELFVFVVRRPRQQVGVRGEREGQERFRLHGPGEQEPLQDVAALLRQEIGLRPRLHAFGHRPKTKALGQPDRRTDDRCIRLAGHQLGGERAVDLERVELEALEIAQRRVAGA